MTEHFPVATTVFDWIPTGSEKTSLLQLLSSLEKQQLSCFCHQLLDGKCNLK